MTGSTIAVDKTVKLGITLPKSIIQRIDKKRGDIPRSRYILRSIENYLSSSSSSSKDTDKRGKAAKKRKR
jgi:metal-responsive CopG/Arc/MetJ family transcriptional regulator